MHGARKAVVFNQPLDEAMLGNAPMNLTEQYDIVCAKGSQDSGECILGRERTLALAGGLCMGVGDHRGEVQSRKRDETSKSDGPGRRFTVLHVMHGVGGEQTRRR